MYSLYGNGDVGGKSDGQVDVEGDGRGCDIKRAPRHISN